VGRREVGIAEGHGQGLVPEQLLQSHQVRSGHDQLGGPNVSALTCGGE